MLASQTSHLKIRILAFELKLETFNGFLQYPGLASQIIMITPTPPISSANQYRVISNRVRYVWVVLIHINDCLHLGSAHYNNISLYDMVPSAEDVQHAHNS